MAKSNVKPIRPALSDENRETRMISLAMDVAEKQLLEGTASSQVITHFLKLGTTNAKLELEREKKERNEVSMRGMEEKEKTILL